MWTLGNVRHYLGLNSPQCGPLFWSPFVSMGYSDIGSLPSINDKPVIVCAWGAQSGTRLCFFWGGGDFHPTLPSNTYSTHDFMFLQSGLVGHFFAANFPLSAARPENTCKPKSKITVYSSL